MGLSNFKAIRQFKVPGVVSHDLVKSRNYDKWISSFTLSLKVNKRRVIAAAGNGSVKFQSDKMSSITNLVASRLHDNCWCDVLPFSACRPWGNTTYNGFLGNDTCEAISFLKIQSINLHFNHTPGSTLSILVPFWFWIQISRLQDFTRSYGKTSFRILRYLHICAAKLCIPQNRDMYVTHMLAILIHLKLFNHYCHKFSWFCDEIKLKHEISHADQLRWSSDQLIMFYSINLSLISFCC